MNIGFAFEYSAEEVARKTMHETTTGSGLGRQSKKGVEPIAKFFRMEIRLL